MDFLLAGCIVQSARLVVHYSNTWCVEKPSRRWGRLTIAPLCFRRGHGEGEDVQRVHQEAQRRRETEDPPGQRTQVHVDVPAAAHLLFPLQRVHLVRRIAATPRSHASHRGSNVTVSVSDFRGVFGKQGYQCQGEKLSVPLFYEQNDSSVTCELFVCLFAVLISVHLCGTQAMPPARRHRVSTHEENDTRAGEAQ